jgi:transmembrane sensor
MSANSRLEYLYERCINASAIPEEQQEFVRLMQLPENETLARQLLSRAFREDKETTDVTGETAATILQAIFSADSTKKEGVADPIALSGRWGGKRYPLKVLRMAGAAAAAVLLLAGGLYWYVHKDSALSPVADNGEMKFDAPPGHAGAILTLADGKRITLDSARNGTLPQQGNTRLLKQGGALKYKETDGGPVSALYNTITTPRGRQYQLVLSDGTRVWLNAASSIRFPAAFHGKDRRVAVTGEAYFEVAPDKSKPFIVAADSTEITVLGTHFDVMAYEDEKDIRTTLLEGSVQMANRSQQVLLVPGRQGIVKRETGKLSDQPVDADQLVAWTKGQLALGSSDLPALMRQISRWYDVDITFQGSVPDLRIGGLIDRNVNLSTVLGFLQDQGLHYRTEGKAITILPQTK